MNELVIFFSELWANLGYRLLLILISLEVMMIGGMLGVLSWQTARRERREARRQKLLDAIQESLEEGDEKAVHDKLGAEARHSEALSQVLVQLAHSGHRQVAQEVWDMLGFATSAREALKSGRSSKRMAAIRQFYLFATDEDCQAIAEALEVDQKHRFRVLAAHVLARFDRGADVARALRGVSLERRIMEQPFYSIFGALSDEALRELLNQDWSGLDLRAREVMLEVAARRGMEAAHDEMKALVADEDMERRIGAVRVATSLGGVEGQQTLARLLEDEAWPVRARAARGLGEIGDDGHLEGLKKAASDDEFWVRENAQWALEALGAELDYHLEPVEETQDTMAAQPAH